ncbi:preprotein translocase subunit SecD [Nanoarchaeota archaeon]
MVYGEKTMKKRLTLRIWILIIVLILSLLAMFGMPPAFMEKGVLVKEVNSNTTIFENGLRQGMIITGVNGNIIETPEDYYKEMQIFTDNQTHKLEITTKNLEIIGLFSPNILSQVVIEDIPPTNIKTGLDLSGGARGIIQAKDKHLTASEASDLAEVIEKRLNVYGIADMTVSPVSDLAGENYVKIEIAGATPEDLERLISEQGKFEAKIGNETVFEGGEDKGITSVTRSGQQVIVEACQQNSGGGYFSNFRFGIFLSEDAAKKHAAITEKMGSSIENPGYLEQPLDLYLDDNLVDTLLIDEGLKGRITTQIQISGSGVGETCEAAEEDAVLSMKNLQTILITGSLPYQLEIANLNTISPVLGSQFLKSIFMAGGAALLVVAIVIFLRYRKLKSSLALLITSISEVIIILGIASLIDWNLDLPSIAGILATIGTGIDQQIIILDETRQSTFLTIKQRIKRAFAIILGAYSTAVVALLPLWLAGAGLLKGFAFTTIIGITAGVLITRPAFSDMIKRIEG